MPKNWQQVEELKTLKNKLQQKIKQNISSIQSTKVNHERKSEVALSTIDVTDSQNECLTNVPSKSNLAIHTEKTKTSKQDIKLDNHCDSAVHVSLIADRDNHGFNSIPEKLDVKSSVGIGLNTYNDLSVLSSKRPYVYTPKCQNVLDRSSQHSKMEEHKYKEKNKVTLSKKKEINTSYSENRNEESEMIIKRLRLDNDSQHNFQNQYINFSTAKLKSNQNSSNPGIKRCKSDIQTQLPMKDKNKNQYARSTKTQIYSKKTYNLSRPQMSKTLNHIKEGEISQENELLKAKMLCCSKKILLNKHRLLKNKWELEMKRHCLSDSSAFSVYKLKQKAFEKQSHLYKLNKIPVSGFSSYHENKSKLSNSNQAKRAYTTSVSAKQSKNKRKMDCFRTKTYALAHPSSQVDTAAFQDNSQTIPSLLGQPVNPAFSNDSYKVLSKKTDDSNLTTEFVWSTSNSVQCSLQSSATAVILPSLTRKSMTETSFVSVACSMVLVPCFAASSSLPTVPPSSVSSSTATVQTGINVASQEFGINTRADNYNSTSLSTAGYKYSGNNMVVSALTLPNGQLFTKSPTSTCFRPLLQNINGSLMPVYDQSKPNSSVAGIHPATYLLPGTANTELRDLNQNQLNTKGGHVRPPANTILSAGSTIMRSLLKNSTSSLERQTPSTAISSTTIHSAAISTDSASTTKVSSTQLCFSKALKQYTSLNIRTCAKPVGNKNSLVSSNGNKNRQGLILGTDQKKTSPTTPPSVSEKETSVSSSNLITKIKLSKHSLASSNGIKTRQGLISGTYQKKTSPTIPPSVSVNETSVSSSKFITNSRQSENQFTSDRTNKHSLMSSNSNKTRQCLVLGTDQKKTSPTIPPSVSVKETSVSNSNLITRIKLTKHSLASSNGNKTRQGLISGTDQKKTSPTIPLSVAVNKTTLSSSKFITNVRQSENQFTNDRTNKHSLVSSNSNKTGLGLILGTDQKKMSPTISLRSVSLTETSVPSTNIITKMKQSENQFTSDSTNKHSLVSSNGNKTGQELISRIDHKKMSPTIPLPSMSVKETSVSCPNFIQNIRQSENQFANDSTSNYALISSYGNKTRQCLILDTDQKKILPTIPPSVTVKETSVSSPNYIPKIRQSESQFTNDSTNNHSLVSSNCTKTRQGLTSGTDQKKMPPTIPPSVSVKETSVSSPNSIPKIRQSESQFTNDSTNNHSLVSSNGTKTRQGLISGTDQKKMSPTIPPSVSVKETFVPSQNFIPFTKDSSNRHNQNSSSVATLPDDESNLELFEQFKVKPSTYKDDRQAYLTASTASFAWHANEAMEGVKLQTNEAKQGVIKYTEDNLPKIEHCFSLSRTVYENMDLTQTNGTALVSSGNIERSELSLSTSTQCRSLTGNGISERAEDQSPQIQVPASNVALLSSQHLNENELFNYLRSSYNEKSKLILLTGNICDKWERIKQTVGASQVSDPVFLDSLLQAAEQMNSKSAISLDVQHTPGTENAVYLDVDSTPSTENAAHLDVDNRSGIENAVYLDVDNTLGTENAVYLDNTLGTENAVYLDNTLGTENAVYLDNTLGTENAAYLDVDHRPGTENAAYLDVYHRPGTENAAYLDVYHRPGTENAAYLDMDGTVPEIGANIDVDQTPGK